MCEVPVFFASADGHTRHIAERLVSRLRRHGIVSDAVDVATKDATELDWRKVRGAVVAAPLRMGRHLHAARDFASARRECLSAVPSLFVSVSLSIASKNQRERDAARDIAAQFVADAGWTAWRVVCVAGALSYTRYNPFVRWFMRRIAAKEGGPTDTTRDHVLTDWAAVDTFADDLADHLVVGTSCRLLRRQA